jgi:hypothetical protein
MMREKQHAELQEALLAGDRDPVLGEHIEQCVDCASLAIQVAKADELACGLAIPPRPDGLVERVVARVGDEQRRRTTSDAGDDVSAAATTSVPFGKTVRRSHRCGYPANPTRIRVFTDGLVALGTGVCIAVALGLLLYGRGGLSQSPRQELAHQEAAARQQADLDHAWRPWLTGAENLMVVTLCMTVSLGIAGLGLAGVRLFVRRWRPMGGYSMGNQEMRGWPQSQRAEDAAPYAPDLGMRVWRSARYTPRR